MTNVSLVKDKDIRKRVIESMELLGGMEQFISRGDVVFVKPNLIYPAPPPLTTHPVVTGTIVELVKEAGAGRIIVGEGGAPVPKRTDGFTVKETFKVTGTQEIVEKFGAEVVCLDEEDYVIREVPGGVIYKEVKLYRSIAECDKRIGVPVLKTHYDTDVSLGIKGWHGVIADAEKFWKFHRDDINQKLVDLARVIDPVLTVIDGTVGMEGSGPLGGTNVEMDIVLASADTVAVDTVASLVMGFDPLDVDHIRIGQMQGLGTADKNKIEVKGTAIEEVQRNFKRPAIKLSAIYPQVTAIEGGPCRACKARARWALDQLNKKGQLEKTTLLIGVDPYIPDPETIEGRIVVVGDCACYFARSLQRLPKEDCLFVRGCPPIPVPEWVPSYYKAAH